MGVDIYELDLQKGLKLLLRANSIEEAEKALAAIIKHLPFYKNKRLVWQYTFLPEYRAKGKYEN